MLGDTGAGMLVPVLLLATTAAVHLHGNKGLWETDDCMHDDEYLPGNGDILRTQKTNWTTV